MTGKPKLVTLSDCKEREGLMKVTRDHHVAIKWLLMMTIDREEIATLKLRPASQ
jgi:hypothetical protein